jgi:hypothetical protein
MEAVGTHAKSGLARTRKRFLVVSLAALAVLGAGLGVSFTADTGVTSIGTGTAGSTNPLISTPVYGTAYSTPGSLGLPTAINGTTGTAGANGWKYGTGVSAVASIPTAPVWPTVVAGTSGEVTSSGDISLIDATDTSATSLLVTIYVTNMKALAKTYNSYSLPIRVYEPTSFNQSPTLGGIVWAGTAATDVNGTNTNNTQGYETFKLATGAGKYYAITLDHGGSFYTYQTNANGAAITPAFYITAQRTS